MIMQKRKGFSFLLALMLVVLCLPGMARAEGIEPRDGAPLSRVFAMKFEIKNNSTGESVWTKNLSPSRDFNIYNSAEKISGPTLDSKTSYTLTITYGPEQAEGYNRSAKINSITAGSFTEIINSYYVEEKLTFSTSGVPGSYAKTGSSSCTFQSPDYGKYTIYVEMDSDPNEAVRKFAISLTFRGPGKEASKTQEIPGGTGLQLTPTLDFGENFYDFTWSKNGSVISDATGRTYITGELKAGDTVVATIKRKNSGPSASNGCDGSESWTYTYNVGSSVIVPPTPKTGLVYNGQAQKLFEDGSAPGYFVTYYPQGEDWIFSVGYDELWNSWKPTNAGTYRVKYYFQKEFMGPAIAQGTVVCTIGKADPSLTKAPGAVNNLTYNGTGQTLVTAGAVSGGKLVYSLDGKTWSADLPKATDAGTYTVHYRIDADGNYNRLVPENNTLQVTVAKKDAPTVVAPQGNTGLVYDGSEKQLLKTEGSITSGGSLVYAVTTSDSAPEAAAFGKQAPSATAAGTYHVWFKAAGDNYVSNVPAKITVAVSQATAQITKEPVAKSGLVYSGADQELITAAESSVGAVSYAVTAADVTEAPTSGYSETIPTAKNAGSYKIWYRVADTDSIIGTQTAAVEVTVAPLALKQSDVNVAKNGDYTGQPHAPEVAVTAGSLTLVKDRDYTASWTEDMTNCGEKQLTVTAKGNFSGEITATYTIEKVTPKAEDFAVVLPSALIYDGVAKTATVEPATGVSGMGGITVKYYSGSKPLADAPTDVGSYTVRLDVAEGTNYKAITNLEVGSFTVTPRTVTVSGITAEEKVYDSSTAAVLRWDKAVISGLVTGETLKVGSASGTYETADAGSGKTLVITALTLASTEEETSGKPDNYQVDLTKCAGTGKIIPLAITVTPTAGQSKVYGEEDPTLTYTLSKSLPGGETLTAPLKRQQGENVGSYAISLAAATANPNYTLTLAEGSHSFTVTALELTASNTAITAPDLAYTGKEQNLTPNLVVTMPDGSTRTLGSSDVTFTGNKGTGIGSYDITVTGKGNFTGTLSVTRKIVPDQQTLDAVVHGTVTPDNVSLSRKEALEKLKDALDSVTEDTKASAAELADWEDAAEKLPDLLKKLDTLDKALNTKEYQAAIKVTPTTVTAGDKDTLEDGKKDIQAYLFAYADNITDAEKAELREQIRDIDACLAEIEKAQPTIDKVEKWLKDNAGKFEPDNLELRDEWEDMDDEIQALPENVRRIAKGALDEDMTDAKSKLYTYKITAIDGSRWTQSSKKDMPFKANGHIDLFEKVLVDGVEVNPAMYELKSGSTLITLKQSFMEKLKKGDHTIVAVYADGQTAPYTFRVVAKSGIPNTGDMIMGAVAVMVVSGTALLVLLLLKKRKK